MMHVPLRQLCMIDSIIFSRNILSLTVFCIINNESRKEVPYNKIVDTNFLIKSLQKNEVWIAIHESFIQYFIP